MCFKLFIHDVGIDLGTANTLIYFKGKGIILNQPSIIAVDSQTKEILATGTEAKKMVGRSPDSIQVIKPLQDGVISDFSMTQAMLKDFLRKAIPSKSVLTRTRIVVGVPSGVTEVEKRAVQEVVHQMGARDIFIIDEPMAAAVGCGLAIANPKASMVADIGGGTSDIAIISLGGIVTSTSLRVAGDKLDEAIILYMRKNYNMLVGEKTAEEIKIEIGCVSHDFINMEETLSANIRGRDLITGLPRTQRVTSRDIMKALEEPINNIIEGIKQTLENSPPEIAADIMDSGMVITGGGALLRGFDKLITQETGLAVRISEHPLEDVALGTGESLDNIEIILNASSQKKNYYR
jgi:rod shape-determining protein MreB and related proteins